MEETKTNDHQEKEVFTLDEILECWMVLNTIPMIKLCMCIIL